MGYRVIRYQAPTCSLVLWSSSHPQTLPGKVTSAGTFCHIQPNRQEGGSCGLVRRKCQVKLYTKVKLGQDISHVANWMVMGHLLVFAWRHTLETKNKAHISVLCCLASITIKYSRR